MTIKNLTLLAALCATAINQCIAPVHAIDRNNKVALLGAWRRVNTENPAYGVMALAGYALVNGVAGVRQWHTLKQTATVAARVAQAQAQMRGRGFHSLKRLHYTRRPHVPNNPASLQEIHTSARQAFEVDAPKLPLVETPVVAIKQPAVPFMSADTEAMFEAIERARQ